MLALVVSLHPGATAATETDPGWNELVAIDQELASLRSPIQVGAVPQLGPEAITSRAETVAKARESLGQFDPQGWSVAGKVDYLLVWARANALEFEHRVTRPWQRDPIFYLNFVRRLPYADLPSLEYLDARIAETADFIERCEANDPDTQRVWGLNFPQKMSPAYRAAAVRPLNKWAKWARSLRTGESDEEIPTHAEFEVNALRLGDVGILGMSCEPFDAIGRQIKRAAPLPLVLPGGYMHDTALAYVPDSGNNGDIEYMSAFYRYTATMLPYAQPAGDRLADVAVGMLAVLADR